MGDRTYDSRGEAHHHANQAIRREDGSTLWGYYISFTPDIISLLPSLPQPHPVTPSPPPEYSCHGWWEDGGREYLVVTPTSRSSKGVRRLCLVLERGVKGLSLASSSMSCSRDLTPGLHGHIALNTTSKGKGAVEGRGGKVGLGGEGEVKYGCGQSEVRLD